MAVCFENRSSIYVFEPIIAKEETFETSAIVFLCLNIPLGLFIILANTAVIWFYSGTHRRLISALYISIATNDLITGLKTKNFTLLVGSFENIRWGQLY